MAPAKVLPPSLIPPPRLTVSPWIKVSKDIPAPQAFAFFPIFTNAHSATFLISPVNHADHFLSYSAMTASIFSFSVELFVALAFF